MTNGQEHDLETKLGILETKTVGLEKKFDVLSERTELGFQKIGKDITALTAAISQVGKTDFKTLISYLLASIVIGGTLYGGWIAPIDTKVKIQEADLASIGRELYEIAVLRTDTKLRMEELETQFRALDTIRNLEFQQQERLNALIWERAFGERFPDRDYWPEVGKAAGSNSSAAKAN